MSDLPWAFAGRSPFCAHCSTGRTCWCSTSRALGWSRWAARGCGTRSGEQSQRGVGVLVTTHYMQEAQQCDRLLLMSQAAWSQGDRG